MGGTEILLGVNLALAGLFAILFAVVAALDLSRPAPRWLSLGLALAMLYTVGEGLIASGMAPLAGHMLASVGYVAALSAIAIGIGHHYGVRVEPKMLAALVIVSVPLYLVLYGMARDSLVRQIAYQAPFLVAQGTCAAVAFIAAPRRGFLDRLLAVVLALNFLNTAGKPLLAYFSGGVGAVPEAYVASTYALISQASGGLLAFLVAALLKAIVTRDIVRTALARSRQDPVTGFLTPRSFDGPLRAALERPDKRQALTVVRISPRAGALTEAAETRLVAALRAATPPWSVRARLDAATFAVLDPAANLIAAQKAMRYVFAEGGGADVSICIGITETEPGDVPATLLARAEAALAQACASGGDCVRLAPKSHVAVPRRPVF